MSDKAVGTGKADVIMAYSFSDIAKAIRELIGLVRDMGSLVGDGAKLYDIRKAKAAAKNLSILEFTPQGSRKFLERIAAGEGTKEDFDGVGLQMAKTAKEVEGSIRKLEQHREHLRIRDGMRAAQKLDDIVYGSAGKRALRQTLTQIAAMGRQPHPSRDEMKAAAVAALAMIQKLNSDLAELHDLVLKLDTK